MWPLDILHFASSLYKAVKVNKNKKNKKINKHEMNIDQKNKGICVFIKRAERHKRKQNLRNSGDSESGPTSSWV